MSLPIVDSYLEPVGDFVVDAGHALHSFGECLNRLAGLESCLYAQKESAELNQTSFPLGFLSLMAMAMDKRTGSPAWRDTRPWPYPP